MNNPFKQSVKMLAKLAGLEIKRTPSPYDAAMEDDFKKLVEKCEGYSAQSVERLYAIYQAIAYLEANEVEGSIVECGVFKGGVPLFIASQLMTLKSETRSFFLYDTFDGMPAPTSKDVELISGRTAEQMLSDMGKEEWSEWSNVPMERVQENIFKSGYSKAKFNLIQGKVEETLPEMAPEKIAFLHLDTDWYESTYHGLVHLYPRLVSGGVLMLDDYGHFQGAKDAVEQYFSEQKIKLLLNRVDYTGRIAIKP